MFQEGKVCCRLITYRKNRAKTFTTKYGYKYKFRVNKTNRMVLTRTRPAGHICRVFGHIPACRLLKGGIIGKENVSFERLMEAYGQAIHQGGNKT